MTDRPRIVVAVDVQTTPARVCEQAARVAGLMGAEAALVYMVKLPLGVGPQVEVEGPDGRVTALELVRREVEDRLAACTGYFEEAGATTSLVVREGEVVSGIWATARDLGAELVVVGSDLVTGLRRLMQKSFTEGVLHEASCPVVVVKTEDAPEPRRPLESLTQLLAETTG